MVVAESKRLLISKLTEQDAHFYLELVNTPSWIEFIGDRNIHTVEEARDRIRNTIATSFVEFGFGAYKLQLKEHDFKTIGSCGLYKRDYLDHPDIGFAMLPDHEGKGYAYESSLAVLDIAKHDFNIEKVLAITVPTNTACIGLLEKLQMEYEKTLFPFDDDEELLLFAKAL